MTASMTTTALAPPVTRAALVGADRAVPLLDGRSARYVNLDNAASTPAFRSVAEAIDEFLPFYSGVHRGTGYKSRVSTAAFERSREVVGAFLGADPDRDVVVFTKNTTEAVNKIARAFPFDADAVVLTTMLEHHSNDLPWRGRASTEHVALGPDGTLDVDHLDRLLAEYGDRVALLAVSGASNVTGVVQPIHELAARVHAVGGLILVDAAQLAPHRPIDMRGHDDPGHLDFVVLSAHKMYAPYGTGAVVGPRAGFGAAPEHAGGGTVMAVTTDSIAWADLPDREEAGSPNVLGAVALAVAVRTLQAIGTDAIVDHERRLTNDAIDRLTQLDGVRVYGPDTNVDRVGVVPFTIDGVDHALAAAIMGYEHAVGVRSGCFCAHPYIAGLLDLSPADTAAWVRRAAGGDKRGVPGLVRISMGCYNDTADLDVAIGAIERIAAGEFAGDYVADHDGSYHPVGYREPMLFAL